MRSLYIVDRTEVSLANTTTLLGYLEEHPESSELLEHVRATIGSLGPMTEKMTKSQVSFQAGKPFARAWAPGQYLGRGAPLVLSVVLPDRDDSPRWKEIVEPSPGRLTHHLELHSITDVDQEVVGWLAAARRAAS